LKKSSQLSAISFQQKSEEAEDYKRLFFLVLLMADG